MSKVKMRCLIGSLTVLPGDPIWEHNEIFETTEELAQHFETNKHAVRFKAPDSEKNIDIPEVGERKKKQKGG